MTRGRTSKLQFGGKHHHLGELATRANNMGIYTVESLTDGIYYFAEDNDLVIASCNGHVKMSLDVAEMLSEELKGIIKDIRTDQREGRTVMDSRSIGKMLESDFI